MGALSATPPLSIIIPAYNHPELLDEFFPTVWREASRYAEQYHTPVDLLLVDDGSAPPLHLPGVSGAGPDSLSAHLLRRGTNGGFGAAINHGVAHAHYPIVVLLNSDMRLDDHFFAPLVAPFAHDESLFAVTARSLLPAEDETRRNESLSRLVIRDGHIEHDQPGLTGAISGDAPCTLLHASGGCSAFRADRFRTLGGFADLYAGGYYEDVDLSFRAWRAGWRVQYCPDATVHHRSHATVSFASRRDIALHTAMHRHLFLWSNFTDADILTHHARAVNRLMSRRDNPAEGGAERRALYLALKRLAPALRRRTTLPEQVRTDAAIIQESACVPVNAALVPNENAA